MHEAALEQLRTQLASERAAAAREREQAASELAATRKATAAKVEKAVAEAEASAAKARRELQRRLEQDGQKQEEALREEFAEQREAEREKRLAHLQQVAVHRLGQLGLVIVITFLATVLVDGQDDLLSFSPAVVAHSVSLLDLRNGWAITLADLSSWAQLLKVLQSSCNSGRSLSLGADIEIGCAAVAL